jgi:hypothetical protein
MRRSNRSTSRRLSNLDINSDDDYTYSFSNDDDSKMKNFEGVVLLC